MNRKISMIFPGQGSQSVGMLSALAEVHPEVRSTFSEASEALGLDLWQLVQNGSDSELNRTENTQPAMLAAGIAVSRVWASQGGPQAVLMAGHSLGEYSALVAAEAIAFDDAIRLVTARGRFMQQAVPEGVGAMAAILGLADEKVIDICQQAAGTETAEAVNFNSPGQVVVAGNAAAITRVIELAKAEGAKRALLLPVSVPSHCALMKPAADQLAEALGKIEVSSPIIPVIHNVDVASSESGKQVKEKLAQQLYRPVRWVETVKFIANEGISTIIEAGPGKVLTGLNKRIDKTLNTLPVTDPAGLEKALEAANA